MANPVNQAFSAARGIIKLNGVQIGWATGFRAEEWVGGRDLRKQDRPSRPPRGSPADMPSAGKWRRLAMFPGSFSRAEVGGGPIATAIATWGYLSGAGTGTRGGSARSGRAGRRTGRGWLDGHFGNRGAVRGIGCQGQSSGELAVPIVRRAEPATADPPGGGMSSCRGVEAVDRFGPGKLFTQWPNPSPTAAPGIRRPTGAAYLPPADAVGRLRGRRRCRRGGGWGR